MAFLSVLRKPKACRWPVKALVVGGGIAPESPEAATGGQQRDFARLSLLAYIAAAEDRDLRKVHKTFQYPHYAM